MAASKRKKGNIKQGGTPVDGIRMGGSPDSVWSLHPVWNVASCDIDAEGSWSFHKERLRDEFWDVIFPRLREFVRMTWSDIFVSSSKQNHGIDPRGLNKCARDRLFDLRIEAESIYSLRLGGGLRLYGFLVGATYNILWYDNDHGDNDTCVCRSHKKHT